MNTKQYRAMGTLDSNQSMQNLMEDIKNANMFTKQYRNKNLVKSPCQSEVQYEQKNKDDVLRRQLSQHCITEKHSGKSDDQIASTSKNMFPLKERTSNNQCSKIQISLPKSVTYLKTKQSQTKNKATISKSNESDTSIKIISEDVIVNMIKESFQNIIQRLDKIEQKENENHSMLLQLSRAKNRKIKNMPECLPFNSIEDFLHFNDINDEIYNEVVDYFIYLGGFNPIDCAAMYFKYAFQNTEEILSQMTWHGTKCFKALKVTRFVHACEDAISSNLNFSKPTRDVFEDAMIKALKSTKERYRRHYKRLQDSENNNMIDATKDEPVIKKSRNKSPENSAQFANFGNIPQQVKNNKIGNYQKYINTHNQNDSGTEVLQNDYSSSDTDVSINYQHSHQSIIFQD